MNCRLYVGTFSVLEYITSRCQQVAHCSSSMSQRSESKTNRPQLGLRQHRRSSAAQARLSRTQALTESVSGQGCFLVASGAFSLGASRGEDGVGSSLGTFPEGTAS